MTTENSRISFKPHAFLAAFGLALALAPTTAKASTLMVVAQSSVPFAIDATVSDVPVITTVLNADAGAITLTNITLNMFGDVPANQLSASMWLDDGDGVFSAGPDVQVGTNVQFNPPGGGVPARAMINATGQTVNFGTPNRYFFTVSFNGVPAGRKLTFGFQMLTDIQASSSHDLQLPFISSPTIVQINVFANPSNGSNNFGTPAAGSVNSGGLDTGIFVQAGQRVHGVVASGDTWDVPGTLDADGGAPTGGLSGAFNAGLLVGRIGSGAWFAMGQVSTITATSAGTLYVAANSTVPYGDTSGSVRVAFEILPSTYSKTWIGGTLGFETNATINQNWIGGRPYNGESVVFGPNTYDCDWNLPFVSVASLTVTTSYTKTIRLIPPTFQPNNRLTIEGDATIRGGVFKVGTATGMQTNTLSVKGHLVVRDGATFDMSAGTIELGSGVDVIAGAVLLGEKNSKVQRAFPASPWYMRVAQATVNVTAAQTEFNDINYLDLIDANVLAFDNLKFQPINASTNPLVRIAAASTVTYTFNNWEAGPPSLRNPTVLASTMTSGSTVTFNGSTAIGGTSFGSPHTVAVPGVVRWVPDGGGPSPGTISGTLSALPSNLGSFHIIASTSPDGVDNTGLGGGKVTDVTLPGGAIYSITSLRAPSTYYVFAYTADGPNVGAHAPRGGFGHAGQFRSEPVYVADATPVTNIDITTMRWAAVTGNVNNQSNLSGPIRVETWNDAVPFTAVSTRIAFGYATPNYLFETQAFDGAVEFSSTVVAFVDANNNGIKEAFEPSQIMTGNSMVFGSTLPVNITITGGGAAPGGAVSLSTQAVHFGVLGVNGPNALIRSRMVTAVNGGAALASVRVRYQGGPLPNPGANFSLWSDDGDGVFNPASDSQRGSSPIFTLGPTTYTVTMNPPLALPPGSTTQVFIVLDLANSGLGFATAGVMIDAATSYTLAAGTFSVTPSFPVQTGPLPILTVVRASETATPELQGGALTQSYFFPGQMISVTSTGTWRTGPGDAPTGPGGAPGTTGLNTVLPAANRGELIGRVQAAAGNSSPWVRVGASSTPFASPGNGELKLAMNDFVGAYSDNTGSIFVGFTAAGSSVGAISGQVFYSTPVFGSTIAVSARLFGTVVSTGFVFVDVSSSYPFVIPGLPPGEYDLTATDSLSSDFGLSNAKAQVSAGTTAYLDVTMYPSTGSISGLIAYTGVQNYGNFKIGVATVTDFSGDVHFFGGAGPSSGPYTVNNLPTPATYYLVGFRDGNGNDQPDGPEPLGYYGAPGGGLNSLQSFLTPVFVGVGLSSTGVTVALQDMGSIEGKILAPGATGMLVIEAGNGVPGSTLYVTENRIKIPLPPGGAPPDGTFYNLSLLRPATGYTLFAFHDKNLDGQPSAGEAQVQLAGAINVPSGGRAVRDFSLVAIGPPPTPGVFSFAPVGGGLNFNWNFTQGATSYQLRRADNSVFVSLGAGTSSYLDLLADNTSSQIRSLTASNGNGTSPALTLQATAYSLASIPTTPVVTLVTATGAVVSWGGSNAAGTFFDVRRTTAATGVQTTVFFGTATTFFNSLVPASTFFWTVKAQNGNGIQTSFSASASTLTLPLAGSSLSGELIYVGSQTLNGTPFVIEASTSSTTFFPRVSSAALPGGARQPWYLPVPAGTYFVRAYVDLAFNGILQANADRGQSGSFTVGAGSVTGVNFTVSADTVPPGAPAGVVAIPGNNKVTVSWVAPTKNANGSNLTDLSGFIVERATSPSAAFFPSNPTALSSATASFIDNFPFPGVPNFYRVRAVDLGTNKSAPSGVVSGLASAGGSISGQIRSFSAATGGQYRVRLSTTPLASAPSVAEATLTSYTFTSLSDGVYYLRAFRDVNGNTIEDSLTEPAGTFGGLSKPFPIAIVNGNAVSGADATICDRSPLFPPYVSGNLIASACPALDKGPGFVTNLFAIKVGGGGAGSVGLGTQINLAMSTATSFATDIFLLGPDGNVFARDNRLGGANLTATLTVPGVYLAEPTSFVSWDAGSFQMNMRFEGGFAGVISGSVTYSGVSTGKVWTQLFNSASQQAIPILTSSTSLAIPTSFSFAGLPDGSYFIRAFRDTNINNVRDNGEPAGQYGFSASSPTAIMVLGGQVTGAPFSVPISDPAVGTIRGAALYEGTNPGALRVEVGRPACPGCSSIGEVVSFTTVAANTIYTLPFLPSSTDYVLRAFVDANGNGQSDALESSISTFPIRVFVNETSTVSLIVQDAGAGAFGTAIVTGTVVYSGVSTGPILVGLSRDPQFRSIEYLLVLSTTGSFFRAGLQGDATYYMAGFIDTNLNNSPDENLGEPAAAGSTEAYAGAVSFDNPPQIYVALTGKTTVELNLTDPPSGSVFGTVRYAGSATALNLIVQANVAGSTGFSKPIRQIIPRTVGVSTYSFNLGFLAAENYYINAFVDSNNNGFGDLSEPFGSRPSIFVSSGSFPVYGADLEVLDPGSLGAALSAGRVRGDMTYLGTQSGPVFVRFFNNPDRLGTPLYTVRIPATGLPAPGSGEFPFDRQNLAFGSYYLDAFRDPSDSGVYNPAAHAYGVINSGAEVELTQNQPDRHVFGGTISDPGQGGSVNSFTGSFEVPGGARFDGGATDLSVMIAIDSYTVPAPQVIVVGVTAQNNGVDAWAVRYSSTGVMLSQAIITTGDLQISGFVSDNAGGLFIPHRLEEANSSSSSATLTNYDTDFLEQGSAVFPNYQGFDGLSFSDATGKLYASSRYQASGQAGQIAVVVIDPTNMVTIGTGTYTPASCQYCYMQVSGGALSPDGNTYVVYAITNKQSDDDRGVHLLISFDVSSPGPSMPWLATKDVTALGVPTNGGGVSMVLDNTGNLYLAFSTDGDTARTYKYSLSGSVITESASVSYSPILVHFSGGMGNLQLDPASGEVFEVWESTTGVGDYMMLRYDQSLNLVGQRFFDGYNNTLEDTGFSLAVYNSSAVFVTGAVNNGQNLDWATVKLNGNLNAAVSAAGTPVIITTSNASDFISGTVSYGGSLVTSGTIRIALLPAYSDVPIRFATATFGTSASFLFNNVPFGLYDIRAFIDPNGNLSPEAGEPIGATTLYGIEFGGDTANNDLVLADPIQLCDRRQIVFDVDVVQSLGVTDCTSPDREGAPRRLYTFQGTRGQPVTIALNAIGFYDSYFDLYGPDGDWLDYSDDEGGDGDALLSNFVLPADGLYTIDAGAYASGSFGQFRLSLSGSQGALGGISGVVNYAGSQGGAVIVGLFDAPVFSSVSALGHLVLTSTRAFAFENLSAGSTYYLGAFIDVNANESPDAGEDSGVFGLSGVPNAILLAPGQIASGVEIAVFPSTTSAALASYLTGTASYAGLQTGSLVLEFWSNTQFTGRPIASRFIPTGVGSYDVAVPGGVPYYVRAYIDANGDFALQPDEARGIYAPNAQGAEQVFAPVGQTLVGIDLTLADPGLTAGGAYAGEGTSVLSSTFAVSGATATLVITYTAGANGIAGGGTGGQIGFTAPPNFPFPIASAAGSSVTVTSAFTTFGAVTYSGPSAYVKLTGAGLAAGQTIQLVWSTVYMPCAVGAATVTVSALQNTVVAGYFPQPLLLGSPALEVVAGPARYVQIDEPYFSVKLLELSDARRLETRDSCGTRVPVTSALTVDLRTKRFNGSIFVPDTEVGVTTSTVLSTDTVTSVSFDVGESTKSFYVLSESTGFKNLEVHYNLLFDTTFYFSVSALPANALTSVSVSTASGGIALSSAVIGLAANGQPNQVFVNFTLGDPQPWHVLISSLPFKSGEKPEGIWERWGYGQPNAGEIAWDGRFSPWILGGVRVPNGLYYTRVEIGGGGIKDDTIRVTVNLPQFAGRAFDPGTVPNPPLSGVQLRVYGPAGYFTAETDADGAYVLPGLGAGSYRFNVSRPDYVDGGIDMTLNALGKATAFVPRTAGLLVSSNATGGLDLFISRAPRLIVVPSLDPSVATVAVVQWGNLQVRPSTSSQQASTLYGPMRLNAGTTVFDDGGQWDTSTQQFIAKTQLTFNVPVGTYTVLADLNGFSRSTGSIYVGPDGAKLNLTPFVPKAVITGTVNLAVAAPVGGLSVGITATALSTTVATTGLSAGAFINGGQTSAVYSLSGFDAGAYLLRANTQGLSAVTTGPIVVVGTTTVTGVDFPNFGAGVSITGTITVAVPDGTQLYVNAWSPGSFNFGSTVVYVNSGSANYAMNGLDAGATYQLYANINAQGDFDVDGGFPRKVLPPAVDSFTLAPASGVISGLIMLTAGSTDFANVTLAGVTIASLHPDEIGRSFVDVSTSLPNFLCWGGASGATGYCPAGVSSATFRVQGINTQTLDIRFLHSTTGQVSRQTVSVVNGSTFTLVSDLSGSTYSISGSLLNQITDTVFNTNAKIFANAPYILPLGYPAGISSSTARVTATRQEIDSFGVAISTVFNPLTSRVGFLDASGNFSIPNCPNGVYIVRTTDLRSCSTCAVISPSVGRTVTIAGASVSSVTLTVSNGFSVSGAITLDGAMRDARIFEIRILNKRQEVVRSTVAYLGDLNLGTQAGSVDYAFTNLPAGEFYTLTVRGQLFPIKYAGRPIKFPDPALSPTGLQADLTNQNVLMQRAAYITGRLKDGATGELIGAANATLLAPNFAITATANPWTEGGFVTAASSVAARPIEADGYFRVGPLVPDVSYDLRLAQTTWDPNFLASGSQNYAPVTIGGVKPTPGEIRDVGTVALGQGQSITGVVRSTTTGLALGNIKVTARPSFGGDDLLVQTFTNSQGAYSLWVSSVVSNQFSVSAAPRGGNQASNGFYYGQVTLSNVNLQTQTSANFLLTPLTGVVTGQVVVADAATGGALSYPFGEKRGFPAAAVNLQPVGVVSDNPLGDIEATTDERGFFTIPGLSTGIYTLHATSLGYAVYNATISVAGTVVSGGVLTLTRGATATGRIFKSNGTSPNSTEVVGVAAANFGAGEFVVGSVEIDAVAKTVSAYTISGFKTGISYNIVLLSGSNGKEVSFPPEGAGVVFTAAESTTTKSINLTYRPANLDCLGTAKALDAARTQFAVQVDCLKPLRQQTAADDDLTAILTASTFTAANAAITAFPAALGTRVLSTDRRRLTGIYSVTTETRFSIRVRAAASEVDPRTGDSFEIDKVFDFYAGLESSADGRASNIDGGFVGMNPSAQDEFLGMDERSRIDLPPGAFGEGSDSLPDASVIAQPTTTVNVSMTKGRDQTLAKALSIASLGYAPAAFEVADVPSAFPAEMWAAMSKYRTMASTSTVGGANPISAFYSIFLPAGIRHQLKQRADLTLSYSLVTSTSTTDDKIQVWFYNAVLGRFVPETTNRRLDTVNKTVTVSVDHFSTFVVLDSTPVLTIAATFGGDKIAVANFPNPADCITHSNIAINSTLFGAGGVHAPFSGTMIRTSIPNGDTANLKINIYSVNGEKIRTIDQGDLAAGKTYYTPWNCSNDSGQAVASGVYIGEAVHGNRHTFFKIAIIRGSGL